MRAIIYYADGTKSEEADLAEVVGYIEGRITPIDIDDQDLLFRAFDIDDDIAGIYDTEDEMYWTVTDYEEEERPASLNPRRTRGTLGR